MKRILRTRPKKRVSSVDMRIRVLESELVRAMAMVQDSHPVTRKRGDDLIRFLEGGLARAKEEKERACSDSNES